MSLVARGLGARGAGLGFSKSPCPRARRPVRNHAEPQQQHTVRMGPGREVMRRSPRGLGRGHRARPKPRGRCVAAACRPRNLSQSCPLSRNMSSARARWVSGCSKRLGHETRARALARPTFWTSPRGPHCPALAAIDRFEEVDHLALLEDWAKYLRPGRSTGGDETVEAARNIRDLIRTAVNTKAKNIRQMQGKARAAGSVWRARGSGRVWRSMCHVLSGAAGARDGLDSEPFGRRCAYAGPRALRGPPNPLLPQHRHGRQRGQGRGPAGGEGPAVLGPLRGAHRGALLPPLRRRGIQ